VNCLGWHIVDVVEISCGSIFGSSVFIVSLTTV
jgi:hypothetical protein